MTQSNLLHGTPASQPDTGLLHKTPAAAFAAVMGLAGLALAWHRAVAVFGVHPAFASAIGVVAAIVYFALATIYVGKWLVLRPLVVAEFAHPVRSAFVPTISIGLLLLGTLLAQHDAVFGEVAWAVGALLHLAFTLRLLAWWINHPELEAKSATPAWFIAPVGNIVVPLAGVRLGHPDVSWFFFSVGIVLWLPLLAIVMWRLYFGGPLPERLRPTLFILLAPPAVAFLSWTALVGQIDPFGRILFGFALFVLLLLATQVRALARLPFFLSWWAYSFPLAAFTVAAMTMGHAVGNRGLLWFAILLLALTTATIAFLFVRTILALIRHEPQLVD
jgi:tellurite resistance protein